MASRPVFVPLTDGRVGVRTESVDFVWSPGLSPSQKLKNVRAMEAAIKPLLPGARVLEVSRRSANRLGQALSAFNLSVEGRHGEGRMCVESVFQSSKVFAGGFGPFPQNCTADPWTAREAVKGAGARPLVAFRFGSDDWPLTPSRAFYDWVYCRMLRGNPELAGALENYDAFTDIEFNPKRSINCQAYAVALYRSLEAAGRLDAALASKEAFLALHPQEVVAAVAKGGRSTAKRRRKTGGAVARRTPRVPPAAEGGGGEFPLFEGLD